VADDVALWFPTIDPPEQVLRRTLLYHDHIMTIQPTASEDKPGAYPTRFRTDVLPREWYTAIYLGDLDLNEEHIQRILTATITELAGELQRRPGAVTAAETKWLARLNTTVPHAAAIERRSVELAKEIAELHASRATAESRRDDPDKVRVIAELTEQSKVLNQRRAALNSDRAAHATWIREGRQAARNLRSGDHTPPSEHDDQRSPGWDRIWGTNSRVSGGTFSSRPAVSCLTSRKSR